jgi:uncharacterized membrane protein YdjX (TVP38/TMEM64 family)
METNLSTAGVSQTPEPRPVLRRYLPVFVLAAVLAIAWLAGVQDYLSLAYLGDQREVLGAWVGNRPIVSSLVFIGIYTSVVALSLPAASVLSIFAGFLFGWLHGGLMVLVAATLGATILFLAARSGFGSLLKNKLGAKAEAFAEGFRKDAFGYLLVLRLAPVLPFFLVNIAPAFFNVKTRDYVLATALGILPGTFAFAWLGEGVGSVLDAAKASGSTPSVSQLVTPQITFAFAALAVVAAIPLVIKRLKGSPNG